MFFQSNTAGNKRSHPGGLSNTNELEVDVPIDGNCLFWAVGLAYLLPHISDSNTFRGALQTLVGPETFFADSEAIRAVLLDYDGKRDTPKVYQGQPLYRLLCVHLRGRVVNYLRENRTLFEAFPDRDETFDVHVARMGQVGEWGGEWELIALSHLLAVNITVQSQGGDTPTYGPEQATQQLRLLHTFATTQSSSTRNHYRYYIAPSHARWYTSHQAHENSSAKRHKTKKALEKTKSLSSVMVLDNVHDYDSIRAYLPKRGGAIITLAESVNLLKSLLPKTLQSSTAELEKLAEKLGRLPLALGQAGAYLRKRQGLLSIDDYLQRYEQHAMTLLANPTQPLGTNHAPVAITWDISITAVIEECPEAIEVLCVSAYLSPDDIPLSILRTYLNKRYADQDVEPRLIACLSTLSDYSLITLSAHDSLSIHRLVQTVIQHTHQRQPGLQQGADTKASGAHTMPYPEYGRAWIILLMRVVHELFWQETSVLEDETRRNVLVNHCTQLALAYVPWQEVGLPCLEYANMLYDEAYVQFKLVQRRKVKSLLRRALATYEQHYGPEHVTTAITLLMFERALAINRLHYGPDHVETARTLENLANMKLNSDDAAEAKSLYERALAIKKQHYGAEHVETARTLNNLAVAMRQLGDTAGAKRSLERALAIKRQHYGVGHVETVGTLENLALMMRQLGDTAGAKPLLERVLAIKKQHYGAEHIAMAATLSNLANAMADLGDAVGAKPLLERALAIYKQHYGPEHVKTAITLGNLANAMLNLGDAAGAKPLSERALAICQKHYGPKHVETAKALHNLANVMRQLGDAAGAKPLSERALAICEKHYGPEHIKTAITLENLAIAMADLGDAAGAKPLLERVLAIKKQHYGAEHIETTKSQFNLALILLDLNEAKAALELARQVKLIFDGYYPYEHPSRQNVARFFEHCETRCASPTSSSSTPRLGR